MYNTQFLHNFTQALSAVIPQLDRQAFLSAFNGEPWDNLELKQRVQWLAEQTDKVLPQHFKEKTEAISRIIDFLRSEKVRDQNFEYIFLCDIISKHGLHDLSSSIPAIEKITSFTSFEFAGRIFLLRYPDEMMAQMLRWAEHPDPNVRRYASEGCRPRLPWGMRLKSFVQNPSPIFPVLEKLINDPSLYVRKSVANNLNDISKDHPGLVREFIIKWKNHSENTNKLLKQAARTLLKKGDEETLKLFGIDHSVSFRVSEFTVMNPEISIGDAQEFSFRLINTGDTREDFRLEYCVGFMKANGHHSKKIFKITEKSLSPDHELKISKLHRFADLTTRRHYPGTHFISVIINGKECNQIDFHLSDRK